MLDSYSETLKPICVTKPVQRFNRDRHGLPMISIPALIFWICIKAVLGEATKSRKQPLELPVNGNKRLSWLEFARRLAI